MVSWFGCCNASSHEEADPLEHIGEAVQNTKAGKLALHVHKAPSFDKVEHKVLKESADDAPPDGGEDDIAEDVLEEDNAELRALWAAEEDKRAAEAAAKAAPLRISKNKGSDSEPIITSEGSKETPDNGKITRLSTSSTSKGEKGGRSSNTSSSTKEVTGWRRKTSIRRSTSSVK